MSMKVLFFSMVLVVSQSPAVVWADQNVGVECEEQARGHAQALINREATEIDENAARVEFISVHQEFEKLVYLYQAWMGMTGRGEVRVEVSGDCEFLGTTYRDIETR